jgi:hypothetical protein
LAYARSLTDVSFDGRALGAPGHEAAAEHIVQVFRSLGLQGGGEGLGFTQTRSRSYQSLDAVPQFAVEGDSTFWVYRQDYAEYPGLYRNVGQFNGPVRVLTMGELTWVRTTFGGSSFAAFRDLDLSGSVIMVLSQREAFNMQRIEKLDGILVVAEDDGALQRRYTLSDRDPTWVMFGTGRERGQDTPILWVSERVGDRILAGTGRTVADLRIESEQFEQDQVLDLPTQTTVSMGVEGTSLQKVPAHHVIGHLPGESDSRYGGLNSQAIVVLAQYDSPPLGPDGTFYPAANDNASGVAVMLEAIRTMQETGYQPYRTFLFIAYSGEGLEGGEPVSPSDVRKFLQAHQGFLKNLEVEAIVHLRGLGAGDGDGLRLSAMGSRRLSRLFLESARRMGVRANPAKEAVDISIVFEEKSRREGGQEAPEVVLAWEGWQDTSRLPTDTPETLSPEKLERAGRALTLALMIVGRETRY